MRRISFESGLVVLVLVANLYAALLPANSLVMNWFSSDDAFYYFKTAQNITEGHGITFDGLGRDSGFHPLWMMVITPLFSLARFDRMLPLRLVVILSAILNAASAVLIYRLVKRFLLPSTAAFTAIFWGFYPFIHRQVTEMGFESGLSAFFIILLIYQVARLEDRLGSRAHSPQTVGDLRQALLIGFTALLTVLSRLDNIFLVLLVGIWMAFRPLRIRYLAVSDIALIGLGVLLAYMLRVGFGLEYGQSAASSYWMVMVAMAVRVPFYYFSGLYNPPASGWKGLAQQLAIAAAAALLATGLIGAIMFGLQALHVFTGFPRLVLIYEGVFALSAVIALRLIAALLTRATLPINEPLHWKQTFFRLAGYYLPLGLGLAAYMGLSLVYFGTSMPVSGQIKRWWGTLPNTIYGQPVETLGGLLGFLPKNGPWDLARALIAWPTALPEWLRLLFYGGFALFILLTQWRRTQKAIHALAFFPLFIGSFVQLISYTGTGYLHMRTWYWVSDIFAITLLLGIVVDGLMCRAQKLQITIPDRFPLLKAKNDPLQLAGVLILLMSIFITGYGIEEIVRRMPMVTSQRMAGYYLESIRELEANTEPGAFIGSTGGGVIAYFINGRTILNLDGLMNSTEYFHLLQRGKASQYLDRIGLDYIYAGENVITDSDPYFQFKGRLKKIKDFGGSTLFRWK